MKQIAAIVNPVSGGGAGERLWSIIEPGLHALCEHINCRKSNVGEDISTLTTNVLADNPDCLLIIGGDGTLSHAINGLFKTDQLVNAQTHIAYFNTGCGGDFARQFPKQKITEFLDRLAHQQYIESNIGKITFANGQVRYFINIASCGLSGKVAMTSANSTWLKKLGGGINYFMHSLLGLLTYKLTPTKITCDDIATTDHTMLMMAMCNGQYFGGKMHVAPMAKINDDLLDVVIFQDYYGLSRIFKLLKIYSGKHMREKNVHYTQARKISVDPLQQEIIVEADGEVVGTLPATFSLLEAKLRLII